jgi:hypothetical protein
MDASKLLDGLYFQIGTGIRIFFSTQTKSISLFSINELIPFREIPENHENRSGERNTKNL